MPAERGVSRREFVKLAAGATGVGAITSGRAVASGGMWPMPGYDLQNRRFNSNTSLAGDSATELWMLTIGDTVESSVVATDGDVYFTDSSGLVYQVTEQGNTTTYDQGIGPSSDSELSTGPSAPTVVDGNLYIGGLDGTLYAITAEASDTNWSFETDAAIQTSPTVTDDRVYVLSADGILYALARDGSEEHWQYQPNGSGRFSLCHIADSIIVASEDRFIHVLAASDGQERMVFETESRVSTPPLGAGGHIYIGTQDGRAYSFDVGREESRWETDIGGVITGPAALDNERVYFSTQEGRLTAVESDTGSVAWDVTLDTKITTGVTATADAIAVGTDAGTISAYTPVEGELLWTYDATTAVTTPLSTATDTLYFGTENGAVHALSSDSGVLYTAQAFTDAAVGQATDATSSIPSSALWISGGAGTLIAAGYAGFRVFSTSSSDTAPTADSNAAAIKRVEDAEPIAGEKEPLEADSGTISFDNIQYEDLEQIQHIGSGGSADVHEARIHIDGTPQTVALKTPHQSGGDTVDASSYSELIEEAELWDTIDDHQRIVTVHGWDDTPLPWIAMEYMEGGTLNENAASLTVDDMFAELEGLCEALHHAHRHGITHTDIKPENILFTESAPHGTGKFTDWGLANVLLDHSMSVYGLTPNYSAPEQIQPEAYGGTDDRTDIYQMGVVAYELFTGQRPYTGSSHGEVINAILNKEPQAPSELNPDLAESIDDVILTAMAEQKESRYETALHFRDDLRRVYHSD